MILTCPDCATRYLTTPEDIGDKGRMVRCSSCQASWHVKAEPDILDLSAEDLPKPNKSPMPQPVKAVEQAGRQAAAHIRDKTYRKRAARRMMGVGLLWGVTLGILGLGTGAAYYLRQPIVQKYPAAATVYKAFGVQVTQNGFSLENITVNSAYIEGVPTVLVEGELVNIDRVSRLAGPIYFDIVDVAGRSLASWTHELEAGPIEPAASVGFVRQYANPPIDGARLRYGFSPYKAPALQLGIEVADQSVNEERVDEARVNKSDESDGAELALTPLAPLSGQN